MAQIFGTVSVKEAAELLHQSPQETWRQVQSGELPAITVSRTKYRKHRIPLMAVQAALQKKAAQAEATASAMRDGYRNCIKNKQPIVTVAEERRRAGLPTE